MKYLTRRMGLVFSRSVACLPGVWLLLAAIVLSVSSNSLVGKGMLNLGYVRLIDFLVVHDVSFSEEEPACPLPPFSSSAYVSPDSTAALLKLERSLRHRDSTSAYLGVGITHLALGDPDRAEQVLRTALSEDEGNPRLHIFLGCAYLQSGQTDSAIFHWRKVPHLRDWRISRGHVLRLEGSWEASLRQYNAVVSVIPSSHIYHLIGKNHSELGNVDEAMSAYRKAIELNQVHQDAYVPEMSRLELAKQYVAQADWQGARTELEEVIAAQPAVAEAYEQLGVVYYKGFNDLHLANRVLLRSIEINPDAARSYLLLGSFNRGQEEYAAAEKWLRDGLTLPANTWTPWLHGELGRVYLEQERYVEAIPELRVVVDAVPTDAWYLELLGDACRSTDRPDDAAHYYLEALRLSPENRRISNKLSIVGNRRP